LKVLPVDNSNSGLLTTFSGGISGIGGMLLEDAVLTTGNVQFSGSSANTFSGPLTVLCQLLEIDKPASTEAFGGPLIIGGGPSSICEVFWQNHYQSPNGSLTLYTNGLANINGFNEKFDAITFNAGRISTYGGELSLNGPVTVNPAGVTALITGNLTLPPGNPVVFNVGQGSTPGGIDLQCNAAISGNALDLIKQGTGIMSMAGTNNYLSTTLVQQGILDVDNASALSTSPVVVSGGATLQFDVGATLGQNFELDGDGVNGNLGAIDCASNSFVTLNGNVLLDAETTLNPAGGNSLITLGGIVSGTGPFTKIGGGYLYFTGNSANTYSGTTFANQGTFELSKSAAVIAVPGNLVIGTENSSFNNNGTSATVLENQSGSIGGTNVTVNGGSSYLMEGHNQSLASVNLNNGGSIQTDFGVLTLTGGNGTTVVGVNTSSSGSVIGGYLLLPTGGNFTVNGYTGALLGAVPPELDVQAVISDTLPEFIEKDGGGQMRLSGPNTFNSAVTVNGGTLTVINSSGLGTSSFGASVNNGAILALSNNVTIGKFLNLNSTNSSGALQSRSGSNVLTGGITLNQTANITVNPGIGYLDIACAINGPGGLDIGGLGTLQLEGTNANAYAGLTTIGSGTLEAARYQLVVKRNFMTGVLTTNKVSQVCIPGDVVIGSDAPGSLPAALQIDYLQQFPTTANIADHLSGSLNFVYLGDGQLQPAIDTIQSLTGSGQVNLVLNSTLTLDSSSPFTFYGSVYGDGGFVFNGSGTMTTWGDINTTGNVGMGGGNWEFFGARHNGGIAVSNGARLGGNGVVDGVVSLSSATLGVDTPPGTFHQKGSPFLVGSLTNAAGATIQLDMFGPSPAGGNDQIITTSGGVSLFSDTMLTTSFSYPPRAGDVIDLISVASGQSITGTFTNFSEGVLTLVGQTPVLPSYHGRSGHDFTLTVTNLALAYVGYELAEGNGNQTVEPNECNLLYVSLVNRRNNALTITNAYLRATTALGVVVTVPVAVYPAVPAGQTVTNTTPFQFKTDTNLPCGGAVAFELVLSVVNEGQFAIDFSPVSGSDCSHPTGPCDSCTIVSGQFTINTPTTNALYFVGTPSICYPPKAYPGTNPAPVLSVTPYLTHSFTNSTTNALCITAELDFACPAAPTNTLGVAAYLGTFDPNNPSVGYLGDMGLGGPPYPVFSFQVPAATNFTVVVMAQTTNLPCNSYSLQLFGLPCQPPVLAIQPEPASTNHVRVNWSTAYPGFGAQQSGKLTGGNFSNVIQSPIILNSRYALTNLPAITNQFYRLKK
jgi:autotransporter-associated beta strand protein